MVESPVVTKLQGTVKSFKRTPLGTVGEISVSIAPNGGGANISFNEQDFGFTCKVGDSVTYARVATSEYTFFTLNCNI